MGNQKVAIISGAAILLVAVVASVGVIVSRNHATTKGPEEVPDHLSTSVKAIQAICQPTDYKETCESTLTDVAGNTTDTKELVKLTFNLTIQSIHYVFNYSNVLSEAAKDPRTSAALEDCRELLDYAIDDLRQSVEKIVDVDVVNIEKFVDDLRVWLTSARTYQETCLDGFDNNTKFGDEISKAMNKSIELTTNVLSIVDEFSTVIGSFKIPFSSRRLLATDGLPSWLSPTKRRLLQLTPAQMKPNVVVAKDGSGQFKTISEALHLIPIDNAKPFIIYIKEGVYAEQVRLDKHMTNVVMVGDGPTKTKITGSLNFIDGTATFKTCTLDVVGNNFIGKDLWVENSAGAIKHQAVAIKVQSDYSVFYNCRFDAYQDTLYAHTNRQFYRDCTISGTIDFIFGNSPSVFQNCLILVRKPLDNQQNIVTAQGRSHRREASGIILHNCTITADPEFAPYKNKFPTYLGRPWKEYSRTLVLQSFIDDLIHPDGWLPWMGNFGLRTCFYSEIDNRGPGADKSHRVTWPGVKNLDFAHAEKFTVDTFIGGSKWLPATGVPYTRGLLPMGAH